MSDKIVVKSRGIGFCGALTILFIGLKLGGVISWSWWWVLAPLWLPLGITLSILAGVLCLALLALAIDRFFENRGL